jgi:hypothetical protein
MDRARMMGSLLDSLNQITGVFDPTGRTLRIPGVFYTPAFWVTICAFAKTNGVGPTGICFDNSDTEGYASAIGLRSALGGEDEYPYERKHKGINYAPLVNLDCAEATDGATSTVNKCIRATLNGVVAGRFVEDLCHVVGDLHDNVWSHGKATGFSTAQRWRVPRRDDVWNFEFALADCGIGFFRELKRVGMGISGDAAAIDWCIQEGHSTKRLTPGDKWAQHVPSDITHNPLVGLPKSENFGNHHLGLGLWNLVHLVQRFRGSLWLATGESLLFLRGKNQRQYMKLRFPWQGVAIACRFNISHLTLPAEEEPDPRVEKIMELLRGR